MPYNIHIKWRRERPHVFLFSILISLSTSSNKSFSFLAFAFKQIQIGMYLESKPMPPVSYFFAIILYVIFFLIFQFEAELLTYCKISNEEEALEAKNVLRDMGVKVVILSSTEFQLTENSLTCLASKRLQDNVNETARITFPTLPAHFVGTGDLFTALTTAWLQHDDFSITSALEKTIATMQAVLKRTLAFAQPRDSEERPVNKSVKIQKRHFLPTSLRRRKNEHWLI